MAKSKNGPSVKLSTNSVTSLPQWKVELEETPEGVAVNITNNEDAWELLVIKNDGTFHRSGGMDNSTGLQIDKQGKLVESEETF